MSAEIIKFPADEAAIEGRRLARIHAGDPFDVCKSLLAIDAAFPSNQRAQRVLDAFDRETARLREET